jgi:hypothetical protein
MRIAVTGSSGLIGSALKERFTSQGHCVHPLVRRPARSGTAEIAWFPATEQIDTQSLEGVDAVVHLAGENIAAGRWTDDRKQRILRSRVSGTTLISKSIASLQSKPRVLISSSAIGYYGSRGDEMVTEDSSAGENFQAEVCLAWEAATRAAAESGIRVVHLRTAMVLSAHGGALDRMVGAFKWCLGGVLGDGKQYMSWIDLDDLVSVIEHLMNTSSIEGAVNACAPEPVTNREFTRTLARTLGRPAILPVPKTAVRLMFGQMGRELLLGSIRALPTRLEQDGFHWQYPKLEASLRHQLQPAEPDAGG